jgi:ribosomal protein L16 Arg81 hydroxylase
VSGGEFELHKSLNLRTGAAFKLDWLLSPVDQKGFFADYWEKQPLLVQRHNPVYYENLLSLRDIDYIISSTDLRYPAVRMVKDGVAVGLAEFAEDVPWGNDTYYGTIIPDKLYEQYRNGASVVFQALHRAWKPLALLCRTLEAELHHHVQTNIYLTPKAAQGFKPHYDTHDVFILQIAGSKCWRIYEPPLQLPHRSQPSNNARLREQPGALIMEFDLQPGDLFYMPRGYVHEALTDHSESVHITVGVTAFTYIEVLSEIMNDALQSLKQESLFRRALPVGFSEQSQLEPELKAKFIELVTQYLEQSNLNEVTGRLARKFINNRSALLDGQLLQLGQIDNLSLESTVCQRSGHVYHFSSDAGKVSLEFEGKTVSFPDYAAPSLQFILEQGENSFQIARITGNLDDAGKIVLVRRLIIEGFLKLITE